MNTTPASASIAVSLDQQSSTSTAPARRTLQRRAPAPLALEPRVMFDGATADAAVAAAKAAAAASDAPVERPTAERGDTRSVEQVPAAVPAPAGERHEILFIEDNVQDFRQLAAQAAPGVEVIVLDHTKDGLQQMIAALDGHAPVDAIHLVSHGLQGQLDLGTARVSGANLDGFGAAFARLGQSLTADGDILIYGCEVGQGAAGADFLGRLAALTGADIAASTDTTGAAVFGGDWTLEAHSGSIETRALDFPGYAGELGVITVDPVTADNIVNNSEKTAVTISGTVSNSGQNVQVTVSDGTNTRTGTTPTSSSNWSVSIDISGLNDGNLTVYVKQANSGTASAGNMDMSKTFTKDTVAPDTTIASGPGATTTSTSASFTFSGSDNNSYQYMLDNSNNWIATPSSLTLNSLSQTAHTLSVRALDAAGNVDGTPATASWTVQHVNSAPVASGNAVLAPVGQLATSPAGATVASLFGSHYSDVDNDQLAGIAITAYTPDASAGRWEVNSGSGWTTLGAVSSASAAVVVKATDSLRFVPSGSFIGNAPALNAKVVEAGQSLTTGATLDASAGGGSTHISAGAIRLTTSVKPSYSLSTPDSQFMTLLSGTRYDPVDDTQSNAADTDLVGTTGTPLLLGGYDIDTKTMYYRVRIGDPTLSKGVPVFTGVVLLGVDTDGDGKLDIFLGVDGRNSGLGVVTYAPGTDANVSPSTTSITAQQSVNGASNHDYSYTLTGGNVGNDSKPDAWLTFKLPFDVLAARVSALKGQTITPTSSLGFVLLTLTQNNSINGDIGGIGALSKAQSATTWKDLGLLLPLNLSAPTLSDIGGNVQYVENGSPLALAPTASFNDFDSTDFSGGKLEVTISGNADAGKDLLSLSSGRVTASNGIFSVDGTQVGTYTFASNVLTVNFTAATVSAEQVTAVLRAAGFSNSSDTPSTLNRTVQFKLTDGDANASAASTVTVLVQAVDDAPTIAGAQTALDRTATSTTTYTAATANSTNALILAPALNTGLSVGDADAGSAQISVTLGVDKGILQLYNGSTLQGSASVTVDNVAFSGSGGGALVMTGTLANINAILAGSNGAAKVIYQPGLSGTAPAILTLSVNDLGNSGSGGPKSVSQKVGTITIASPVTTGTLSGGVTEDLNLSSGNLTASGALSAVINTNGISFAGNTLGSGALGTLSGAGSATWTYTLNDSLATVQALADGQSIQETFQVATAGGTVYVRVSIAGVNDKPTLAATATSAAYTENGSATALFSGAAATFGAGETGQGFGSLALNVTNVFDGDQLVVDGTVIALDKAASNVLTAGGYTLSVSQSGTTSSITVSMSDASAAALQTLVNGIAFQSGSENPTNYGTNTSRVFTITALQDNGGTNNGGQNTAALSLVRTLAITAVNDAPVLNVAPLVLNQNSSITVDAGTLSANDQDTLKPSLVYTVTGAPAKGTLLLNGVAVTGSTSFTQADVDAGKLSYRANAYASAQTDAFTVQVSDGAATASKTVGIDIITTNYAPSTEDGRVATNEDVGYVFVPGDFVFRDANTGDALSAVELYSLPNKGTLQVLGNGGWADASAHQQVSVADILAGKLRFLPALNESGTGYASFNFKVIDKAGAASGDAVITVDVAPVNDAPVAANLAITMAEDTVKSGSLPAAVDPEGNPFTYAKGSNGTHGTVTVATDGSYTYTPDANFNGTDTFTYTVGDGQASNSYTVTVTVTPVNDLPVGANGSATTPEDTVKQGSLPGASDIDGDTIVYAKTGNPSHGTVVVAADGSYTYTPETNYNGSDSFSYSIDDQHGGVVGYTMNVTVTPVNDAPSASDTAIGTLEDTAKTGQLPAAKDIDNDSITYAKASNPSHGTVSVTGSGGYTYTPAANFNGTDSFTYTVSDGSESSTYTVTVTVDPVNDAPTASDDTIATLENTARSGTLPAASDIEHNPVSYSKASDPAHGTVTVDAAGNYTYTPNTGYVGSDIFTYSVSDGDKSTTYKIDVTVGAGNHAPLGQDGSITTLEDNAKQGTLPLASDPDGDPVTYARLAGPSKGTVLIGSDGSYTYTPDADYNGLDTFTYTVSDGHGGSNTYRVDVTVTPVNDAPTAANTSITTLEDTAKTGQLPVAHDVEGSAVTYAKGSNPAHGTVSVTGSGGYTYTPEANYNGIDSFTYTVSDGDKSSSYTVAVTVDPVNDAPTAGDGAIATLENVAKTGSLPAASDIEHDPITYVKAGDPQHGTVTVTAAGGYTYTPNEGYVGSDVFAYSVSDGDKSTTYKIDVTVGAGNHAPTAANGSIATLQNIAKSGTLPAASDIDDDPVSYAKASDPQHGTVTVTAAGGYTYTPNEGYVGNDAFTYRVTDGDKSTTYTIAVAVGAGNHAPLGQDSSFSTPEATPKSGTLPAAIDADGDQVAYARLAGPANGTVVIGTGGGYTYTPNAGYTGGDSFTYTVDDGHGGSNSYTVEVTVTPVDHTPMGADTAFHTPEDTVRTGLLPAASVSGGTATYARAGDPLHGKVSIGAGGGYAYIPDPDYNGPDSFTYTVSSAGASSVYTVDITVDPVNDAPTAGGASFSTLEDTSLSGRLPAANDIDGDVVSYRLATNAQHGSASVGTDGRFSYTPSRDYNGSDSFRYTVADGKGGAITYTVDLTVEPVNDAPVAHGGASGKGLVGEPMTPVTVPPFTDVDSPIITYTATLADGKPLPGWLSFDPATLSFTGTPPGGSLGSYAVTLIGSDGKLSDSTTITITVANPPAPSQSVAIAAMDKDTGASPTDFVTNDGSAGRAVTGSIGAPLGRNEVVQVSFDGGSTWSTAATSGTSWSIVDGGVHGGNWTIAARVTNTVAGLSGASVAREVVLDTVAPAAPDPDDVTTTVTTPRLTGTATLGQGETLRVTVNGASYALPAPGGSWTLDLASATPLSGGGPTLEVGRNYEVSAVVTDLAGNTRSGTGTLSISAPVVPSAPAPVAQAPAAAALEPVQPSPVLQAAGSGVRATLDAVVPGSVVGGDTLLFGAGQGARAGEQAPAIDLRGAELSDVYTRSEGFRTVVAKAEEPALVVFQGVPDQFVETGAALSMTVPADAFAHTQPKAIVRLVAVQQDGRALPGWVQFNSQTGQFTGDVPKGQQGELKVKLVARDMEGREATALFRINVGQQRMLQGDKAAPAGKPGLSQQLRGAQARR